MTSECVSTVNMYLNVSISNYIALDIYLISKWRYICLYVDKNPENGPSRSWSTDARPVGGDN